MNIAYLIMVHKNPEQFKRLFKAIYNDTNTYLIHIDKKSDKNVHTIIRDFLALYPNASIMKSQNCLWGGYSMIDIELKAIALSLRMNDQWDFFINLSGQCFPLKSQREIKAYLSNNKDSNFIDVFDPLNKGRWADPLYRVRNIHFEFRDRVIRTSIKRSFMKNTQWYAGSQWFILNRHFCNYVISKNADKYRRFFKYTHIPDESFFQTVIMNSEFRDTVINDNKRTIEWGNKSVRILTHTDYDYLVAENTFFARKFDSSISAEILDMLENKLAGPVKTGPQREPNCVT